MKRIETSSLNSNGSNSNMKSKRKVQENVISTDTSSSNAVESSYDSRKMNRPL